MSPAEGPRKWLEERAVPERLLVADSHKRGFLAKELALLDEPRVFDYCRKVAETEIDRANPQNSWVMWVLGKVETINEEEGAKVKPSRSALPDIDTDLPVYARDKVVDYLAAKYGQDRVAQMATFSRLQGKGALKEVLRANGRCGFEEMNRVTDHIPDEAAIADELQEMAEAGEDPSILMWALEHIPGKLKEWCWLTEEGELEGPMARDFAQAIRLEGTKRSQGKHASGLVICSVPIAEVAPMLSDKSDGLVVGVDMRDAEELGLVKFDLLGVASQDKQMAAIAIIRGESD